MTYPVQGGGQAYMRASDADRERAADVLKAGYAEGRLLQDEYDQRLHQVHRARTYAEIQPLISDLPQGPVPARAPAPAPVSAPVPVPYARPVAPAAYWAGQPRPVPPPTSGWAIASLVCAVTAPAWGVTALPAVITGHIAKAEIRRTGKQGDGYATAGLVVGYLGLALGVLLVLFFVAAV
ncbi:DUF1707 and DUF4190 domain-containing protein [Streptomyces sp. TRM 70351]|uniref:DUF1707 and DUF4190 domain-containing protein n=1 Tax=Streptomyces sp. TRM 70351 TaxID=3116552 RepID=UPI002E7BC736|nr:DUF1707 and DUF4190 domain-containing protein [Streptomyces sp. TRM 70351]MEE1930916.1 DUF1707 and DUF4190 domain-containing protein [Streptomyces sp. TRM 70351]